MVKQSIEQLATKLCENIPGLSPTLKEDIEKNFRAILQGTFNKLDLVTREEFEVQTALLAKARVRLEALEKRLAEMEKHKP